MTIDAYTKTALPNDEACVETQVDLFWQLCKWSLKDDQLLCEIGDYLNREDTMDLIREYESSGTYPATIRKALHNLGVSDILFSSPIDPHPCNTLAHMYGLMYLSSQLSSSVGIDVGVNVLALLPLYSAGSSKQKEKTAQVMSEGKYFSLLITEKSNGSDIFSNQFSHELIAIGDSRNYQLNGEKDWINGGSTHEFQLVLSRERSSFLNRTTAKSFTLFLTGLRSETIFATKQWRNCPAPAADIASVRYDQHLCTDSNIVGVPGSGFSLVQDSFSITRGLVGAGAAGLASCITTSIEKQVRGRHLYKQPLSNIEVVASKYEKARAIELVIVCVTLKCLHVQNIYGVSASHYSNLTKYATTAFLEELVLLGKEILSAQALFEEYSFHRILRDYPLLAIFDGTSDICLEQIQSKLTKSASAKFTSPISISNFSKIFTADIQSIHDTLKQNNDESIVLFRPDTYAQATNVDLHYGCNTHELSVLLIDTIEELKQSGYWFKRQSYRHSAARALVYLECIFAINDICTRTNHGTELATLAHLSESICTEKVARNLMSLPANDKKHARRLGEILAASAIRQQNNGV